MRIVIAPDSFKGSATATDAARALREGWLRVRPDDGIRMLPMADGGEGTLDAFEAAVPGVRRLPLTVTGPAGGPVDASWLLLPPTDETPHGTAVVELAATSGITLLDELLPLDAHTIGFGQAIAAALDHKVSRILLAVGGSASTDGGAGALGALGARILDASGVPVVPGGRGLADAASLDLSGMPDLPAGGTIVLSDVTIPLLGDTGAAAVFGPQKGASPQQVAVLDESLARFAALAGVDPESPGAGAAGGAAYGLLTWGARIAPGADAVAGALGMDAALTAADIVITGEGRFDSQSAAGKVPIFVAERAAASGCRAMLVAGRIDAPADDFAEAVELATLAGSAAAAQSEAHRWLREAGSLLASRA